MCLDFVCLTLARFNGCRPAETSTIGRQGSSVCVDRGLSVADWTGLQSLEAVLATYGVH